jgi:hypothetical protein
MSCVPPGAAAEAYAARAAAAGGGGGGGWWPRCTDGQLLPCFLQFGPYDVPRGDSSNMRCAPVERKPPGVAERDCRTGTAFTLLDNADEVGLQQWDVPPSYFQYRGCTCLAGYQETWTRNRTRLSCDAARAAPLPPWTWVLVALGAVLALLAVSIAMLGSRLLLFRSRWAREIELKRKRARGPPKGGGVISVVVTDIEGYSGGGPGRGFAPSEVAAGALAARGHIQSCLGGRLECAAGPEGAPRRVGGWGLGPRRAAGLRPNALSSGRHLKGSVAPALLPALAALPPGQ